MFKDYFNFDIFITTTIVKILYALLCVLGLLGGLGSVAMGLFGFTRSFSFGLVQTLVGIGILVIGVPLYLILVRIWFEVILVVFKINENLQRISDAKGA